MGAFQHALDPMHLTDPLLDSLCPVAGESTHGALPLRGNDTGLEQAKAHQLGSPAGIGLVGFPPWAMHVKGLEMPGYEPRSLKTMALGLAVSTRGACHNRSSTYEADFSARVDRLRAEVARGRITMEGEDFSAVLDSLIWCKFLRKAFQDLYAESAVIYEHITGWPMTAEDLRRAGERINNLKKLFNIREGWQRPDDTLPPRVLTETLPTGSVQGSGPTQADLDLMIQGYYAARGWTAEGLIPVQKLRELGSVEMGRAEVCPGAGLPASDGV